MREFEHLISCKATFLSDEVVQLPIGREFLSKPVKARGEWFITFYFGWHHQVELVKLIDMKDLKDFKGLTDELLGQARPGRPLRSLVLPNFVKPFHFNFNSKNRLYNVNSECKYFGFYMHLKIFKDIETITEIKIT